MVERFPAARLSASPAARKDAELSARLATRRDAELSARLAAWSDAELSALLAAAPAPVVSVGGASTTVDVGGTPVFVKRIPLTDRELAFPHSTANLFDLPLRCQYGVGSPGFNAWRELAAHEAVDGGPFPRLHHWRVLPGRPPLAPFDSVLGDEPAVRTRLEALAAATWSLVLFLQYLPMPLVIREEHAGFFEDQLSAIVAFLADRRVLHMDGHPGNLLTDGERIYLADFGLATSPRFELSPAERAFVAGHENHDAWYASRVLVNTVVRDFLGVDDLAARYAYVSRCADGCVPPGVPPALAAILARHAPAAARMNAFYWRLFDGDLSAAFPAAPEQIRDQSIRDGRPGHSGKGGIGAAETGS